MMIAPCRNCEDRDAFCHSTCKRYKEFRRAKDRENKQIKKEQWLYHALESNEVERNERFKRRPKG